MEESKQLSKFKTIRVIDGKLRKAIVDICGDIINDNPTDKELKQIKRYPGTDSGTILKLPEEYGKEYLLEFLRYFHHKEGRVPEQMDFNRNPKYPHFHIYQKVFGSWNNAIRAAGLQPNWGGRKKSKIYTDDKLLEFPIKFYEEEGIVPTQKDFINNPKYPSFMVYISRFESWQKSLKIIGLDVDSMIMRGIIETNDQKRRLGEIFVRDHFKEIGVIDKSGENRKSPYDGISPDKYNYDVKTSSFFDSYYWWFELRNVNIYEIEHFYLLAFNEDFTELLYAWTIPALDITEEIEKKGMYIGLKNLKNLKQYETTEKIKPMFAKWKNNLRKWTKKEILDDARSKLKSFQIKNRGE